MKDYTELLEWLDKWSKQWTEANTTVLENRLPEAAAAIRELLEREKKLSVLFDVAELFCRVETCRKCDNYYPIGYLCRHCGEDNSDDEE